MTLVATLFLSLFLLGQGGASPTSPAPSDVDRDEVFKNALSQYETAKAMKNNNNPEAQQRYHAALAGFQSLIKSGIHNGPLYYNLANTYLSLGDVGRAILNYRRAARISPDNENIERNMQFARKLCEVQIPRSAGNAVVRTIFFWHFDTALATRLKVFLWSYCAVWLLLGLRLFTSRRIPTVFWTTVVAGVITVASSASVGWDTLVARSRQEGAVVAKNAVLRKGSGEYYDPELDRPLQPGVEFRAMETRKDVNGNSWFHIRLEGGKSGWLRDNQVEMI